MSEIEATLLRIDVKLEQLIAVASQYQNHSYDIETIDDLEKGERTCRLKNARVPPFDLSIDVSEIVGLMRTVLDHLMFYLVVTRRGSMPSGVNVKDIQFPIIGIGGTLNISSSKNLAYDLSPRVWAWLESLQPGSRTNPKELPLVMLNALVNVAKHRFHNSVGAVGHQRTSLIGWNMPQAELRRVELKDDAIIAILRPSKAESFPDLPGVTAFTFNSPNINSMKGGPWTQSEWDSYWAECNVNIEIAQTLEFGADSDVVAGFPVIETLRCIRDYLRNEIFTERNVLEGF